MRHAMRLFQELIGLGLALSLPVSGSQAAIQLVAKQPTHFTIAAWTQELVLENLQNYFTGDQKDHLSFSLPSVPENLYSATLDKDNLKVRAKVNASGDETLTVIASTPTGEKVSLPLVFKITPWTKKTGSYGTAKVTLYQPLKFEPVDISNFPPNLHVKTVQEQPSKGKAEASIENGKFIATYRADQDSIGEEKIRFIIKQDEFALAEFSAKVQVSWSRLKSSYDPANVKLGDLINLNLPTPDALIAIGGDHALSATDFSGCDSLGKLTPEKGPFKSGQTILSFKAGAPGKCTLKYTLQRKGIKLIEFSAPLTISEK